MREKGIKHKMSTGLSVSVVLIICQLYLKDIVTALLTFILFVAELFSLLSEVH